eukprot:scaffold135303_cov27-Prasinocladus_malaysianus.AAC.1
MLCRSVPDSNACVIASSSVSGFEAVAGGEAHASELEKSLVPPWTPRETPTTLASSLSVTSKYVIGDLEVGLRDALEGNHHAVGELSPADERALVAEAESGVQHGNSRPDEMRPQRRGEVVVGLVKGDVSPAAEVGRLVVDAVEREVEAVGESDLLDVVVALLERQDFATAGVDGIRIDTPSRAGRVVGRLESQGGVLEVEAVDKHLAEAGGRW